MSKYNSLYRTYKRIIKNAPNKYTQSPKNQTKEVGKDTIEVPTPTNNTDQTWWGKDTTKDEVLEPKAPESTKEESTWEQQPLYRYTVKASTYSKKPTVKKKQTLEEWFNGLGYSEDTEHTLLYNNIYDMLLMSKDL